MMNMSTDILKELRNLDKSDVLNALGLESRKESTDYALPVLGIFVAGLITGIGAGLMLAPKSGESMREDAKDMARDARGQVSGKMDEAKDKAKDHVKDAAGKVSEHVAD